MSNTSTAEIEKIGISDKLLQDKDSVSLPPKLKHITEVISEASCILFFEEDWDDNGANATDEKTFKKAIDFLTLYAVTVLKYGIIAKPYIDIMRDGAVSIFWETEKATLLIIFTKNTNSISYFYGEEKTRKIPFRYAIENGKEPDEIVTLWMSRNLM